MIITKYAKIFAVGAIGAGLGLAANSLNAQSGNSGGDTALAISNDGEIWHASGNVLRRCSYHPNTYAEIRCTDWE